MNMIEKVAMALAEKHYAARLWSPKDPNFISQVAQANLHLFTDQARAAIEAMREPSGLVEYTVDRLFNFPPHAGHGKEYWQRMVNAALKEE